MTEQQILNDENVDSDVNDDKSTVNGDVVDNTSLKIIEDVANKANKVTNLVEDVKHSQCFNAAIKAEQVLKSSVDGTNSSNSNSKNENKNKNEENLVEARIHSDWLQDYITYTQFQESPQIFHLWVGISVIAATLNRNVYIQRGYNKLFPNLYTILVSPTGKSKKSSAANIGINEFLEKIDGIRILRDESTPKGLVHFLNLSPFKMEGTKATRACTGFIYATELSDLLGEQSYNQGLIKKLTALWDCPNVYDDNTKEAITKNKNNEPTRLVNVCLNFLGCSNPEWLAHGLKEDSFGGGFIGRTLYIYSTERRKTDESAWMDVPEYIKIMQLTLLRDLDRISKLKGAFKVQDDAHKYFIELYRKHDGDFSGRMAGYLERKLTFVLKLAMIFSVNESDSLIIEKKHIDVALKRLSEIETVMANAFVYINATNEAKISQHIIDKIKESGGAEYRTKLVAEFRHLVRNLREFDDVIAMLIEANVIRAIRKEDKLVYVFAALYEKLQQDMSAEMREVMAIENQEKITLQ